MVRRAAAEAMLSLGVEPEFSETEGFVDIRRQNGSFCSTTLVGENPVGTLEGRDPDD